jgi:hypothetical protein
VLRSPDNFEIIDAWRGGAALDPLDFHASYAKKRWRPKEHDPPKRDFFVRARSLPHQVREMIFGKGFYNSLCSYY